MNLDEENLENHEDITLRSEAEIEEPKEVEEVVKELNEQVENEG